MNKIRKKQPRVIYPGSTIPQNYSEDSIKGFLLWDIKDKKDWEVNFYPVKHENPFVTVDWQGNVTDTVTECIRKWPSGARYRIKTSQQLAPKIQRKLSTILRREYNAYEVLFKLENKSNVVREITTNNKLDVYDLSTSDSHKNLIRQWTTEQFKQEVWDEVDNILDQLVPQLDNKTLSRNQKWSIKEMNFSNTFGYGEDNKINFENLHGVIGLFGPNRAGKSSIPGTMMYGLYNSNDRGISTIAHVINYRANECHCDITFEVNGRFYRLERQSIRYVNNRGGNDGAMSYLNLFEVEEDGTIIKDLSEEQRRETEKILRDLIGTSDEFMMTSFAAQGNMNSFIEKGATERKKLLSSFMGLDVFENLNRLVKEESAYIKGALKRLTPKDWESEIEVLKNKIKSIVEDNSNLEHEKNIFLEKLENLKKDIKPEDDFVDPNLISKFEKHLLTLKSKLESNIEELNTANIEQDNIMTILEKYEEIKINFPIEQYRRRLENLIDFEKKMYKMQNTLDSEQRKLDTQNHSVKLLKEVPCGDQFPTCKFIAESHRNKELLKDQRDLVKDLRSQLEDLKSQIVDLEQEGLKNKIARYEAMLSKESKDKLDLTKLEHSIDLLEKSIESLKKEIFALEDKILDLKTRMDGDKSEQAKLLQSNIEKITKKIRSNEASYISNIKEIGNKNALIKKLEDEKNEYNKLTVEWQVYELLISATSWKGIPTYIMSKQIPTINNELSAILSDVTGFTLELVVDEKNTDIYINYGDSVRPIECGSGMEKMVSSMALRVAMNNVSSLSKSDMFIVDEGFGALDDENIESVTALLHRLKQYYKLILVISHVDVIKDNVDDIITIGRKNSNSFVKYE